jgi:hypothetical protein
MKAWKPLRALFLVLFAVSVMAKTLTFTPGPSLSREALTETMRVGNEGFTHNFNAAPRPLSRFHLETGPLLKSEAECLSALHAYHQGYRAFFWDGALYGNTGGYITIGQGDGTGRKDFQLPNRYIGHANSISVRILNRDTQDNELTAFTTNLNAGVVTLTTAPASGIFVQAAYSHFYRVNFDPDGFKLEQVATDLYVAAFDLVENPNTVGDRPVLPPADAIRLSLNVIVPLAPALVRRVEGKELISAEARFAPTIATRVFAPINMQVFSGTTQLTAVFSTRTQRAFTSQILSAATQLTAVFSTRTQRAFTSQVLSATTRLAPTLATFHQRAITSQPMSAVTRLAATIMTQHIVTAPVSFTAHARTLAAQVYGKPVLTRETTHEFRGRMTISSGAVTAVISHAPYTLLTEDSETPLFALETIHYVTLVPDWNTTWWVTSYGTTGTAIAFGTQIGSGGGNVDWGIFT